MSNPIHDSQLLENRRQFFGRSSTGIGVAALACLLNQTGVADETNSRSVGLAGVPHFAPKAKRVIYLLGRTVYSQGSVKSFGRDHHPRCFTIWMAGGGIKPGISYGRTDDYCYNITENPVHVHDFHATILHCLGIDHERLVYRFQGRDYRLTDVHGDVIRGILA